MLVDASDVKASFSNQDKIDKIQFTTHKVTDPSFFTDENQCYVYATNTDLYKCEVYYQFGDRLEDEANNDTTIWDRSGNFRNSTGNTGLNNAKEIGYNGFGKALKDKTISTPTMPQFNDLTIFCRVYPNQDEAIVSKAGGQVTLEVTGGKVKFTVNGYSVTSGNSVSMGAWNSIVGVVNSNEMYVIVNEVVTKASYNGGVITSDTYTLGLTNGMIDDFRMYSKSLQPEYWVDLQKQGKPFSELIFGGLVTSVSQSGIKGTKAQVKVDAHGWAMSLKSKVVSRIIEGETIKDVITDLVNTYFSSLGFVLDVKGGDKGINNLAFHYQPLLDIIKELGKINYPDDMIVSVTADKRIIVKPASTASPRLTFDDTKGDFRYDIKHKTDYKTLLDRVVLQGGKITVDDYKKENIPDGSKTTDAKYYAVRFIPSSNKISGFKLPLKKVGSPSDLTLYVVKDNGGVPADVNKQENLIVNVSVKAEQVGSSVKWVSVLFGSDHTQFVKEGSTYWLVAVKNGDASNHYVWYGESIGSSTEVTESSDGSAWSNISYQLGIIEMSQINAIITMDKGGARIDEARSEDIIIKPEINNVALLADIAEKTLEKFSHAFEEVSFSSTKEEAFQLRVGDAIDIKVSKALPITIDKTFVIQEIEYSITARGVNAYVSITASASERVKSLEDIIAEVNEEIVNERLQRITPTDSTLYNSTVIKQGIGVGATVEKKDMNDFPILNANIGVDVKAELVNMPLWVNNIWRDAMPSSFIEGKYPYAEWIDGYEQLITPYARQEILFSGRISSDINMGWFGKRGGYDRLGYVVNVKGTNGNNVKIYLTAKSKDSKWIRVLEIGSVSGASVIVGELDLKYGEYGIEVSGLGAGEYVDLEVIASWKVLKKEFNRGMRI